MKLWHSDLDSCDTSMVNAAFVEDAKVILQQVRALLLKYGDNPKARFGAVNILATTIMAEREHLSRDPDPSETAHEFWDAVERRRA